MLILHIAKTSLSGAPLHLVNAINSYTDFTARLLVHNQYSHPKHHFGVDLCFSQHKQEALTLIAQADILHFHHYFDISSQQNPFGINFRKIAKSSAKFIRQFHAPPRYNAKEAKVTANYIVQDTSVPQLVVAQAMERFFAHARLVPNILPIDDPAYLPLPLSVHLANNQTSEALRVGFSPSKLRPWWADRWETKGAPSIIKMLQSLQATNQLQAEISANLSLPECLAQKQTVDVGIDDLFTGAVHLSGLEFLSMGIATLNYLDERTAEVLAFMTGSDKLPFVNVPFLAAKDKLLAMGKDKQEVKEQGKRSRAWMEKYYRPELLIAYYVQAYELLLSDAPTSQWCKDQAQIKYLHDLPALANKLKIIEQKHFANRLHWQIAANVYLHAHHLAVKLKRSLRK